jgi:phosphatidylglycerophosphate synthase
MKEPCQVAADNSGAQRWYERCNCGFARCQMPDDSFSEGGHFRARDLWLTPNLVSLLRVPLALIFPWVSREPPRALAVLIAAAVTDVLDGFLARRLQRSTALGAVLDGVLDKLFAAVVAGVLLWQRQVSPSEAALLFVRELMELPLVVWWAIDPGQRSRRLRRREANWLGKLATVIQFCSLAAILGASSLRTVLIAVTGSCGALAAAVYWSRELEASRPRVQRDG